MKTCAIVSLVVILLFTSPTNAGIRPSFVLDYCAWQATHIVVATEGDEIDGKLTVLESWKGDLRAGEMIRIPELASFKSRSSREVKQDVFGARSAKPPKYVTGSRMILFLEKKDRTAETASDTAERGTVQYEWEPASRQGINVSVVWVEGDESFAFIQVMNPGPSILTYHRGSETEIRVRALEVMEIREAENGAIAIKDASKRAEALESFAGSDLYFARALAFEELQKCGEGALPVLRKMLSDQTLLRLHRDVIESLTAVGGDGVADELTAIVKDEMEFWKATATQLKDGWWNDINDPVTETLRNRYSKVYTTLYSLRKLKTVGCKEVVIEFRDFWRSVPLLEDKSGLNQMSQECDNILRELR